MSGVANPAEHALLDQRKAELEAALRSRWAGADRAALKGLAPEGQVESMGVFGPVG